MMIINAGSASNTWMDTQHQNHWVTVNQNCDTPLYTENVYKQKTSEIVKGDSSFPNSLAVARRVKHRITVWPSNCISRCILKRRKAGLPRNLCISIHRNNIYNSQKAKTTQMSINLWRDQVLCILHGIPPYKRVLFTIKRNDILVDGTYRWVLKLLN